MNKFINENFKNELIEAKREGEVEIIKGMMENHIPLEIIKKCAKLDDEELAAVIKIITTENAVNA